MVCGFIGLLIMYYYVAYRLPDTFTSYGTMYVYNSNPNLINYQYATSGDLDSAVQLIDTYMIVVRSNKVMDVVAERLSSEYPGIEPAFISRTLSMSSVSNTGVVRVSATTSDPQMSANIANAVLDVAPAEIIRVVGAGNIEIIDYAEVRNIPDNRMPLRRSMTGGLLGGAAGGLLILVFYFFDQRVSSERELTDNYKLPILSSIRRRKMHGSDSSLMLSQKSAMEQIESYAKLRMNLLHAIEGKDSHTIGITSAISGEGKSTIAANLSISCAMAGKRVLLVDADMRRACQQDIFRLKKPVRGLADVLEGKYSWKVTVVQNITNSLDLLPAGTIPENPSDLLGSGEMAALMAELEKEYDLVILDLAPINIVSDPLVLSPCLAGCVIIVRQDYSDLRDITAALVSAEMTGMNIEGFVFYGENIREGSYYSRKYYKRYYSQYDYRSNSSKKSASNKDTFKDTSEKSTSEKSTSEKSTSEKSTSEKDDSNKGTYEKGDSNKGTSEKSTPVKITSEKGTPEKAGSEKTASDLLACSGDQNQ